MPRSKVKFGYLKNTIKKFFHIFNLEITRRNNFMHRYNDFITEISNEEEEILSKIKPFCLTSRANQWSIIQSLKYLKNKNIFGDIVECGVFRGGSLMLIILMLQKLNLNSKIIGYDTFEKGFDKISDYDLSIKGKKQDQYPIFEKGFFPTINDVLNNFEKINIKKEFFPKLIKGKTQETLKIKSNIPEKISFLRLDTDIYEPTKNQLEILYPKLNSGGILHIDDYAFPGVKKAVDDYFSGQNIWLHRVDYTCRLLIKS